MIRRSSTGTAGLPLRAACLLLTTAMPLAGCGTRATTSIPVEVPPPVQQLRQLLGSYAESGQLDSGVVAIREQIDALRSSDASKAESLAADLGKLETLKSPAAVKELASAMLGKLE